MLTKVDKRKLTCLQKRAERGIAEEAKYPVKIYVKVRAGMLLELCKEICSHRQMARQLLRFVKGARRC